MVEHCNLNFSLKMPMAWRSSQLRSCASTTPRTLASSAALGVSTTSMAPLEHGKVNLSFSNDCFSRINVEIIQFVCNVILPTGGREKAPAAFCRKAQTSTERFEMWGDGLQTRSFTFIDECVEGVLRYVATFRIVHDVLRLCLHRTELGK